MTKLQVEELRQRLFMVKNRLLNECSKYNNAEQQQLEINKSFSSTTFEKLIELANMDLKNKSNLQNYEIKMLIKSDLPSSI
jgi:hypothetical protein